jgi:Fe-S-cluster containining protein
MARAQKTLKEILAELDNLRRQADAAFSRVAQEHPEAVACRLGCTDCCHALFDLTPIEALAIALAFLNLPRNLRQAARRRAEKAAAVFDQALAQAFAQKGEERLQALSRARVPCPLLQKERCLLYQDRPITCRLYGIPVAIEGKSRTCHLSRFAPGQTYPTVDLSLVQNQLERLSRLALGLIPNLSPGRRDVARTLELAYSHGPVLSALAK